MLIRFYELTDKYDNSNKVYCLSTKNLLEKVKDYISECDIDDFETDEEILYDAYWASKNYACFTIRDIKRDIKRAIKTLEEDIVNKKINDLMYKVRKLKVGDTINFCSVVIKLCYIGDIDNEDYDKYTKNYEYRELAHEDFVELMKKI